MSNHVNLLHISDYYDTVLIFMSDSLTTTIIDHNFYWPLLSVTTTISDHYYQWPLPSLDTDYWPLLKKHVFEIRSVHNFQKISSLVPCTCSTMHMFYHAHVLSCTCSTMHMFYHAHVVAATITHIVAGLLLTIIIIIITISLVDSAITL